MKYILLAILALTAMQVTATTCRSSSVKHKFDVSQGCPSGRRDYIVDHVCALSVGGLDSIANMQYQTIGDSKAKDKIERTALGKLLYCNESNSTKTRQVFNCKD